MDEDFIERRFRELRHTIASSLKEPTLCTHLFSLHVITEKDENKVRTMMQNDPYAANLELFDCVIRSEERGKWKSFLDALQETGYESIRQSLMSPSNADDDCTKHVHYIIQNFTKYLAESMNGAIPNIVPILISKNILSQVDKDNINSELNNKGDYQANLMLLDRMKCRAMPQKWYLEFLQALVDVGYDDIVKRMEPEFINKRYTLFDSVVDRKGSRTLDAGNGPEENIVDTTIKEHVIHGYGDAEMDTEDLTAPPLSPLAHSTDKSMVNKSGVDRRVDRNTHLRQSKLSPDVTRQQRICSTDPKIAEMWCTIQGIIGDAEKWPKKIQKKFWTQGLNYLDRIITSAFVFVNKLDTDVFFEWVNLVGVVSNASHLNHFKAILRSLERGDKKHLYAYNVSKGRDEYIDGTHRISANQSGHSK